MNKFIKKAIVTVVAGFALLGAGGSALAASGYIQWGGTQAKESTVITLQEIAKVAGQIKAEKETVARENEQLVNTVKDKENVIKDRDNQIAAKQKEIDALKNSSTVDLDKLKQAEQDMKEIDQQAKDVLNGLK